MQDDHGQDVAAGDNADRRRWMGILARAGRSELEEAWNGLREQPAYEWLRQPEVGLVMVRARAGGTGDAFNMTEMSMTRCALRLADGTTGYSYVQGRDTRQAELAAVFDALMQKPEHRLAIAGTVIERLEGKQAERRLQKSLKAASTKVEFFTMVRAETKK
ncbi:phosphonate C-P lyase system protein PhnG [Rhizobium mayense]|uniref:Phosphonate C-P lyase system protein PhnG n=1 Tax=Rhizobium mayense TaxID=1312184 RepID=A0ABT7JUQ4_9HYPH|nr:phosphonate C-P lyase system protein PhnG [Rhizobium mayense]MDL2400071.1 phosphonate C-P lyase system protein PhnG [Rhizobium mayense]